MIHLSSWGQRSGGKTGPGQIRGRAEDRLGEYGIADQVVVALFAVDHQIMGIEVKTQGFGKVGQPEHPGLQSHRYVPGQHGIEFRHGLAGGREGAPGQAEAGEPGKAL